MPFVTRQQAAVTRRKRSLSAKGTMPHPEITEVKGDGNGDHALPDTQMVGPKGAHGESPGCSEARAPPWDRAPSSTRALKGARNVPITKAPSVIQAYVRPFYFLQELV